jgi:hypothetical protein
MPQKYLATRTLIGCLAVAAAVARADQPPAATADTSSVSATDQLLAETLATIVRESIPLEYARKKGWGHTKRITIGVTTDEPLYKFKLHRRKKDVPHGTWKQYRVKLIEPDEQLRVYVENLHSLEAAGVGMRLIVQAELDGWAQMRHYNRGVHLLTLTAEGSSRLRLAVDCEVRMRMSEKGMVVAPVVTAARLDLNDFELDRLGEIEGKLAHELGKGMKSLVEDQLDGPQLTAKLNRAIHKKRDRLVLGLGSWSWGASGLATEDEHATMPAR